MKKAMSLIVVLLASFTVYIYSFTTIVLGDIYTAFPGQDSVTVLIASLPAVVMMISAFASAFLLAKFNRKLLVIISMVIAVAAGLVVAYVEIPVAGIVTCSALMGIPAGVVAAANASVLPSIAPDSLKDKVMGFHQAALMLGQTLFALICGFFARGGNWAGGFKTVYVIIPVIILVILFYPDIPVESVSDEKQEESKKLGNEEHHRMPTYAIFSRMHILERLVSQQFRLHNQRSTARRYYTCRRRELTVHGGQHDRLRCGIVLDESVQGMVASDCPAYRRCLHIPAYRNSHNTLLLHCGNWLPARYNDSDICAANIHRPRSQG